MGLLGNDTLEGYKAGSISLLETWGECEGHSDPAHTCHTVMPQTA